MIAQGQKDFIPDEAFFWFLKTRVGLLDGVSICGGEPTLQPDLYDVAKRIKEMWFLVKLDTNGRDVAVVMKMVDDEVLDYVAVDCKNSWKKWDGTAWVRVRNDFRKSYDQLLDFLKKETVPYEYRTTVIKGWHDVHDVKKMAEYLGCIDHYYLQNFVSRSGVLDPNFVGESFSGEELEEMRGVAEKFVGMCGVRG